MSEKSASENVKAVLASLTLARLKRYSSAICYVLTPFMLAHKER